MRRYRNISGFIICLFLIIILGIISFASINRFNDSVDWVTHTYTVLNRVEVIEKEAHKAEAATRGYMITGEEKYRNIYTAAISSLAPSRSELRNLISDNLNQVKRVQQLDLLMDQKLQFLQSKIDQRNLAGKNYNAEDQAIVSGNNLMVRINEITEVIKNEELSLLQTRTKDTKKTRLVSEWLIIVGTVLNSLLVIVMIFNIQTSFSRRRRAEKQLSANNLELQELIEKDKIQKWVLNGANEINSQMRAADTIDELAENVINSLCHYINAPLGGFYVTNNETKTVQLLSSFGFTNNHQQYKMNEGIVGQVAASGKTLSLTNLPEDYIKIHSGIGDSVPKCVSVIPVHYNDKVNGVLEFAFLEKPSEDSIALLDFVKKNIGSGINTGQLHQSMNALNTQLQEQSEALQKQQEELKSTNEELMSQSEALQASEEELRVQQEELQQTNAELEEKAQLLAEKNDALDSARIGLQQKAEELEQSSRYKSEFLANMSHELRTPLNSILILAKLLADNKTDNLNDKQVEYAKVIHKSGNDLLNLINDILDLSKIEAGKLDLTIEEIAVDEIVDDIHFLFKEVANSKKINFNIDVASGVPEKIKTDKVRLEQVVRNLLSNAFKFTMPNGNIDLNIRLSSPTDVFKNPELCSAKNILMISVTDSGIGIPKEKQQLIFEAFQQADGATTRKFGGTGLGLSISRQLALMLGGELQVQSEEQKGSTFTLCMPVEFDEQVNTERKTRKVEAVAHHNDPEDEFKDDRSLIKTGDDVLLIIEDDTVTAELFQRMAREKKYKTVVALQGDLGLYYAKLYKPKAIILDVYLPVMDGFTVLKKLKEDPEVSAIPVHMVSGMKELPKNKGKGRASFNSKPLSAEDTEHLFEEIRKTGAKTVKNILIIEDDTIHQQYLQNLIREEEPGVESFIAADTDDAIKIANEHVIDCVIVDLQLNNTSGIDTLKKLRTITELKKTPVIVYTARNVTKEEDNQIREYANTIVLKGARSQKRLLEEITLFLHHVNEIKETPALSAPPAETQKILKGKKVLLVDDDMRNVFALSSILHDQQLQVIVAGDGKEALEKLAENSDIDIILMDIMMPEMDGYQAMQEIRKDPKHKDLPIIALTAKAMKDDREKCLQAGASDYITKPVDTDQLISLMKVWLYAA
jgi:signal transduction histidine kinase/CheY-like chemotaxis protein/CHASE3 domain sensor protein/putative methionine-R-sulfoxide reductase with GAF domain